MKVEKSPPYDWFKDVSGIIKNENSYKIEVLEELSEKVSNLSSRIRNSSSTIVEDEIVIGPVIDDIEMEGWSAIISIKENFLRKLEENKFIETLSFGRIYISDDIAIEGFAPMGNECVSAKFSFIPVKLKQALKTIEKKLLASDNSDAYITRNNGEYRYRGVLINLPDSSYYRIVFECLFELVDRGGFVSYDTLGSELRERITTKKGLSKTTMTKFIRENLSKNNGLFRYAKVGGESLRNDIPGGKKLIEIKRGKGIQFNNRM